MNILGISLVCIFSLAALTQSRSIAALSLLGAMLFVTEGQSVNLGLNFFALRFVEIAVFIRVVTKGELSKITFTQIDRWLMIFFCTLLLLNSIQRGSVDLYQLGTVVDCWLVYFSFRALIGSAEEYTKFMRSSVFLLIPFAFLMVLEGSTGRNLFAAMGGVPESPILREGHYRCQGSFRVPITAGSLGATYFPLFVGFFFQRSCRKWSFFGLAACFAIVLASRSSGPLMAILTGIAGWACWRIRGKMKWIRRGIVALLLGLHLVMKQPVWFIFDRISGVLGGDGWHRSNLIDKFFLHVSEWWAVGMPFINTADWAATQLPWGGVDVTNYYVSIGLTGGLLTLVFFIRFLVVGFGLLGQTASMMREFGGAMREQEALVWGIGCTLCAHTVNLTAVLYWDQSYVFWYLHLAMAASMVAHFSYLKDPASYLTVTDSLDFESEANRTAEPY